MECVSSLIHFHRLGQRSELVGKHFRNLSEGLRCPTPFDKCIESLKALLPNSRGRFRHKAMPLSDNPPKKSQKCDHAAIADGPSQPKPMEEGSLAIFSRRSGRPPVRPSPNCPQNQPPQRPACAWPHSVTAATFKTDRERLGDVGSLR